MTNAGSEYAEFYFGGNCARFDYGSRAQAEEHRLAPFVIGDACMQDMPGLQADECSFYREASEWSYRSGLILPSFAA